MSERGRYGLMAAFADADTLVEASRAAHKKGYRKMDAYTPMPIEGLGELLGCGEREKAKVSWLALAGGVFGGCCAYALQYTSTTLGWYFLSGGKPANSWPDFIIITFEMTVLFATFGAVFGMFWLNGFPKLYHPVFNVERFSRASSDEFFLCIEDRDERFDIEKTREFLEQFKPIEIVEVPK
ncbi:MAG TPA: DUF3341 domain-containing protein [Gammaproteobacteria bacterium]|nr:DUF3341 domain-containing protein [Gammaproteobacteria bacterium]